MIKYFFENKIVKKYQISYFWHLHIKVICFEFYMIIWMLKLAGSAVYILLIAKYTELFLIIKNFERARGNAQNQRQLDNKRLAKFLIEISWYNESIETIKFYQFWLFILTFWLTNLSFGALKSWVLLNSSIVCANRSDYQPHNFRKSTTFFLLSDKSIWLCMSFHE